MTITVPSYINSNINLSFQVSNNDILYYYNITSNKITIYYINSLFEIVYTYTSFTGLWFNLYDFVYKDNINDIFFRINFTLNSKNINIYNSNITNIYNTSSLILTGLLSNVFTIPNILFPILSPISIAKSSEIPPSI